MVAKRAFPFIRESHIWNWNILDSHLDEFMHTGALFNVAVRSSCDKLDCWKGDIIIEACNLWKAWIRGKIYGAVRDITRVHDYQEYYLNYLPDAELVASRVTHRNRSGEERWHSVDEVKQELKRCVQRTKDRDWELFNTEESIRYRIEKILAPNQ